MPEMTMTDAAKWSGKSRTTIFKAIKSGKISAKTNESGEYRIDPAELERVFRPAVVNVQGNDRGERSDIAEKMAGLQAENALLREQLAKSEERETKLIGLFESQTRLLTDQRTKEKTGWRFWKRG